MGLVITGVEHDKNLSDDDFCVNLRPCDDKLLHTDTEANKPDKQLMVLKNHCLL